MSEANKAIVQRFFEEVYNRGNLAVVHDIFHPAFGGGHGLKGPARILHTVMLFRKVFPDIRFTVEDLIAEGDKVVVRVSFSGTHRGEFLGIAPTGRQVTGTGIEIVRLVDGQIVEGWHEYDALGLVRQLQAPAGPDA